MIVCKIDYNKIDANYLFRGKQSDYMDLLLIENKDGKDKYGYDGFIVQGVSKEAKEAGEQGPIIGNYRIYEKRNKQRDDRNQRRGTTESHPTRDEYNQERRGGREEYNQQREQRPRRERPPF